jgi:hypothetical protein
MVRQCGSVRQGINSARFLENTEAFKHPRSLSIFVVKPPLIWGRYEVVFGAWWVSARE